MRLTNRQLLNALLYVLENVRSGERFPGSSELAYHLRRHEPMVEKGVIDRMFERLQLEQILRARVELFALDPTSFKVHPDAAGR